MAKKAYPSDYKPPIAYGKDFVGVTPDGTLSVRYTGGVRPRRRSSAHLVVGGYLVAALLALVPTASGASELVVYPPVPGLAASEAFNVRLAGDANPWQSAFACEIVCKTVEKKTMSTSKNQAVRWADGARAS